MLFTECFSARTRLVVIIAVCTLLAACSPGAEAILPTVTLTATVLPTPTETPAPTATPLPPDLPFSGFYTKRDDPNHLYILNNSLHNWETIEFPAGSHMDRIGNAFSPDKNWVVFETGSIDAGEIALNLMYLPDQSVITVAELLSDRYPNDLLEIVDQVIYEDPEISGPWDKISTVSSAFRHNLGNYAWSPDGRYLAFIGQMDGPSSDIYMYDMTLGELTRITADMHLVGEIQWSPAGEKIVFTHLMPTGAILDVRTTHVADVLDQNINNPKEILPKTYISWLSDKEYLVSSTGDGIPPSGLKAYNVESGQSRSLWSGVFYEWAVNSDDQSILLFGTLDFLEDRELQEWGIYLVDSNGEWEEVMAVDPSTGKYIESLVDINRWDGTASDFLITYLDTVYSYSPESGLVELTSVEGLPPISISPDLRWIVLLTLTYSHVYNENGQLVVEIPANIGLTKWGPNSDGFFYLDDSWLHYISLPDGEITALEPCPERACWIYQGEIVWLED